MITDLNSYRHKQKLAHINELVKHLTAVRADIRRLKMEECQLRNTIRELAQELDWPE
ncbi:hypothetical protein P378_04745 [Desulforamulus profundi]|uniref:Uncharacterized protein n=1 Tax=Desulforamulus profundi TaxID=1383067 RepID=A0A2C6MA83_9FIRM|nr:hypothetical protein [Desulforamulus profundi]PHJ39267.1 hypothetical protein P378_04745 [Desulforamulus profundi]